MDSRFTSIFSFYSLTSELITRIGDKIHALFREKSVYLVNISVIFLGISQVILGRWLGKYSKQYDVVK